MTSAHASSESERFFAGLNRLLRLLRNLFLALVALVGFGLIGGSSQKDNTGGMVTGMLIVFAVAAWIAWRAHRRLRATRFDGVDD